MRPLKLSFQSFGSYADRTVVDFDRPELNMFLISGDTGSGKSTIFDALCYALYGCRSSSGIQKPEQIQSQYAGADCAPFVELEFLGSDGRPYRIRRVPPHERVKKRGTGTKQELASVRLTTPDGELTGNRDVNARIEELVGLTKDQFTQVALIAQGEFMRILSMNTTERKTIFQKLFNTSVYARIAARVKEVHAERQKKLELLRESLRMDAAGFRIPDDYERGELFETARAEFMEKTNVASRLEDFLTEAERLLGWSAEQRARAEQQAREFDEAYRAAVKKYEAASQLDRRFAEMEEARGRFRELQSRLEDFEDKRTLARRIEDAWFIGDRHGEYGRNQRRARELEEAVEDALRRLPGFREAAALAAAAETAALTAQLRENAECEKTLEKARAAIRLLDEYEEAEKEREKESANLAAARKREEELQRRADASEERLRALADRTRALAGAAEEWNDWRVRRQEVRELEEKVAVYEKELRGWKRKKKALRDADERRRNAERLCALEQEAFEEAERALKEAEASRLAESLRPGEPCPVCGSTEHPRPYSQSISADAKALLDAADARRDRREAARVELARASATAQSAREALADSEARAKEAFEQTRARYEEFRRGRPDVQPSSVVSKDAGDVIRALAASLDAREQSLREDKELGEKLEAELENQRREAQDLRDRLARARTETAGLAASVEGKIAVAAQARGRLTYTDRARAEEDARKARERKDEADRRARAAQKDADDARAQVQKTEQGVRTNRENLERRRQDLESSRLSYETAMAERGLAEEEWSRCVSRHRREEATDLREEIAEFDKLFSASQQSYADRFKVVEGKERPDLRALVEEQDEAEERRDAAASRVAELTSALETNRDCWEKTRKKAEECERAAEEHAVAEELHRCVGGKAKGSNMDLEAFAQRQYLEAVLRSANERLRRMARYELQTVPLDTASAQGMRNQGLDLRVLSLATGKVRDVSTLSGGESFMAALCMAMGLADQIESSSAAVRLDFLFLDEGFGSLDKKACREAIRVLEETVGDSRMVGVISHVETLRETIPDQLLVTKDLNGSHLKWKE